MSKDESCMLSYRGESGDDMHLSPTDVCVITFILSYQNHLGDQSLFPDYGSFTHVSISLNDLNSFRTHPDNLDSLSHSRHIKVETP